MSTKPRRPRAFASLLMLLGAGAIGACASQAPDAPVTHFGELRFGRPATQPSPLRPAPPVSATFAQSDEPPPLPRAQRVEPGPSLRPRLVSPSEPAPVLPVRLDAATMRVASYLDHAGFALEQRPEGTGRLVSATRMGAPSVLQGEAVCGLEALHRPDISSTDLTVRLTPAPGGVQVETSARFVEVDTKLLSGTLARQTCRSRGVLEGEVRRAASGG